MNVMFKEEDCPNGWANYLTPGKVYVATDVDWDADLAKIENDDGNIIHIIVRGFLCCSHINDGTWTILED